MKTSERLEAVRSDGSRTLEDLGRILELISAVKPEPELLVLMVNSIIVAAVSAVEEAFRQLFVEYLTLIEEVVDTHTKLRPELQKANAYKTHAALKLMMDNPDKTEAVKLLENLRVCLSGEPGYRLAKMSIANNQGNFKSAQLTDIAKLMGINGIWAKIANDESVANYTGHSIGSRCTERLISEWNDVFEERDTVVHRLSNASGWSAARTEEAIAMFQLVLLRFAACLDADIAALLETAPALSPKVT